MQSTCKTARLGWLRQESCFNIMEGVTPPVEWSRFSVLQWKWAQSHCTGSSEQYVEPSFTRVTGDLTCGVPLSGIKNSCNRNANGGSDLYRLVCSASVAASSLTVKGAEKPRIKQKIMGWHFMSPWRILCFIAEHTETVHEHTQKHVNMARHW